MRVVSVILLLYLLLPISPRCQIKYDSVVGLDYYVIAGGVGIQTIDLLLNDADESVFFSGEYENELYLTTTWRTDTFLLSGIVHDYTEAFVAKYDSGGAYQWLWAIDGTKQSRSVIQTMSSTGNGEILISVIFSDTIWFPDGDTLISFGGEDSFVGVLDQEGKFKLIAVITGIGQQMIKNILERENSSFDLYFSRVYVPEIVVGNDTLKDPDNVHNSTIILRIDSSGNVEKSVRFKPVTGSELHLYAYTQDLLGSIYLVFFVRGITLNSPGSFVLESDTFTMQGYKLISLNSDWDIEWITELSTANGLDNQKLTTDTDGNIYFTSDETGIIPGSHGFIEKFGPDGSRKWKISTEGRYRESSMDLIEVKDYLLWAGYYQVSFQLDTIHYVIGDLEPWPSPATTGFIALINKHTGKTEWVMSDGSRVEAKKYKRVLTNQSGDRYLVACEVGAERFITDTVDFYIPMSYWPEGVLFQIRSKPFPEINPVIDDFLIYPNPVETRLNILWNPGFGTHPLAEIYDVQGRRIISTELGPDRTNIELSPLSTGIYLLKLSSPNNSLSSVKKFIKQ